MKTRLAILLKAVIITALVFTGCASSGGEHKKYIFATDMVKYNLEGIEIFGFNVNFLSKDKEPNIEFVSFEGENAQGLSVELMDDTFEGIKELKHNGYYIRLLGFSCKTSDSYVEINSVNLKIDGVEEKFDFSTPIKHYVKKGADHSDDSYVYPLNYPAIINTNSYSSTEFDFVYSTDEDVTVESLAFNDFLTVKSATVSIDGTNVGTLDSFPLSLKKGSTLSMRCYLDFEAPENSTDYDSIYCDTILSYKTSKSDELLSFKTNLVSQSVSNEIDAQNAIDSILKIE